ncbi:MAG: PIN domain-containing protein [Prevotella sp.]|jgi:predicted nucleic acid-binding protein|nr:PIN domain-containing protein [Prevotella sp.]
MIILDTTIWIEFLRKNQDYFSKICKLLENKEILAIECVFGELLQGAKNNSEKEMIKNYWNHLPKNNYENIIIEAGLYSSENKLLDKGVGLIDTIILMHGIRSNTKIWTLDTKFLRIIPEELIYADKEE